MNLLSRVGRKCGIVESGNRLSGGNVEALSREFVESGGRETGNRLIGDDGRESGILFVGAHICAQRRERDNLFGIPIIYKV